MYLEGGLEGSWSEIWKNSEKFDPTSDLVLANKYYDSSFLDNDGLVGFLTSSGKYYMFRWDLSVSYRHYLIYGLILASKSLDSSLCAGVV